LPCGEQRLLMNRCEPVRSTPSRRKEWAFSLQSEKNTNEGMQKEEKKSGAPKPLLVPRMRSQLKQRVQRSTRPATASAEIGQTITQARTVKKTDRFTSRRKGHREKRRSGTTKPHFDNELSSPRLSRVSWGRSRVRTDPIFTVCL